MALELFAGAGLGVLFGELQKEICRVKKNFEIFKPKLEELEQTLALLSPVIQEIEELNKRLNRPNHGGETFKLRTLLEDGIKLVSKCSKIPRWKRGRYGGKLVELENKILKFHNVCLLGPMARDQKQNLLLSQATTKMMFMYLNEQGFSNITMGLTDPSDLTTPSSTGSSNITVSLSTFGESNTSGSSLQAIVFLQLKSMRELYLPELTGMHHTIAAKLQLHEPLPHQAKLEQLERLKMFKIMLEHLIAFLLVSKDQIVPGFKDKMALYENQIITFITNRPRRVMSSMQSGQLPPHHMQLASQPQSLGIVTPGIISPSPLLAKFSGPNGSHVISNAMDANWRPTQGAESTMDTSDWRTQLQPDSRQRIVNKIMDTLKRHLPVSGQDGLHELRKIAQRFEEKIYAAATSQSDYVRKISLKMLTMENKTQNTMVNAMQSNAGGPSNKPIDSGIPLQSQVHNPGQSHAIPVPNQSQSRQQLPSQNIQNNIAPPVSNIGQTPIQNVVGTNSNVQNNMFGGSQRQMPPRQQVVPQQQQQSQNSQPYHYQQQQLQQQYLKHKIQPGDIQHSLMQPHIHMQQQQQPNQLQSSQSSVMQTSSVMQPSITQISLPTLQQNQQANNVQQSTQPMLQQHSQSVIRQQQQQTSINNQQQTPISQQPIMPPQQQQQQQQLLAPLSNVTSMQHPQLLGQQNNVGDMQQHQRLSMQHPQLLGQQNNVGDMQQHQRLLVGQQNNLSNLQQHQQQQPHLINQQNNLSNIHQQQLGSNVPGLQQQQLLLPQSGNSGMQPNQHSAHMVQQSKVSVQQQSQQNVTNLLQSQGQQSQPQAPQQQLMPQIQSQPAQMQQQLGMQQQPNLLQRDMQQIIQGSSSLLQQQNALDQQRQLYQSQRNLPDSSSTSLDSTAQTGKSGGDDWQEEVFQKLKSMKESYLPELTEMHKEIAAKLQLHEPLPHQAKSEQLEKLKMFKIMLERLIAFLLVPKDQIASGFKDKMALYEKQIINFINTNRPKRPMSSQLPSHHMQLASQPQSQSPQQTPISQQPIMPPQQQQQLLAPQSNVTSMQQMFQNQHSSPLVDSENLLLLGKVSTSMQSANPHYVGTTPSPPLAPSPMPGDSKKPISVVSSVSNAANIGHQQKVIATVSAKSLAIVTPGIISPSSPLLAKFGGPNGSHGNALAISSAKLTVALLFFFVFWLVFYRC